jgi:NAD(P)-dependent dehydrogenase (short-subunit alcohol dehydrogenase family)
MEESMETTLAGRVALVTGGGGGIGAATCRVLAERGASLVVADLSAEAASRVADELSDRGADAMAVTVDISSPEQVDRLFETIARRHGRLDILDNNAAALTEDLARRDTDIARMPLDVWDTTFAVNVRGTMMCCAHALRIMEGQKSGVIINTASNLALQGNVIQAAYSASKAAIIQMTRSIATSHGKRGIRCNAVLPGLTASPAALENLPQRLREIVEEETLTPYLGHPDDIAHTVAFLASDEARYITGQAIVADGGTSAHIPGFARLSELFGIGSI